MPFAVSVPELDFGGVDLPAWCVLVSGAGVVVFGLGLVAVFCVDLGVADVDVGLGPGRVDVGGRCDGDHDCFPGGNWPTVCLDVPSLGCRNLCYDWHDGTLLNGRDQGSNQGALA